MSVQNIPAVLQALAPAEAARLARQLARRYPSAALEGVAETLAPAPFSAERRAWFIIACICALFGVGVPQMRGASRERRVTEARQIAMCLVIRHTRLSSGAAGRLFRRDHSTVLHAVARAPQLPGYELGASQVEQLLRELEADYEPARRLMDVLEASFVDS